MANRRSHGLSCRLEQQERNYMLWNKMNVAAMCLFFSMVCTINLYAKAVTMTDNQRLVIELIPSVRREPSGLTVTTTDNQRLAVKVIEELLDTLKNESQFSFDRGHYFFKEMNYLEFALMRPLGYRDEAGRWLKPQPVQSYLGSLLMMKKNLLLPSSSEYIPTFSVVDVNGPEAVIDNEIKVVVFYGRDKRQNIKDLSDEKHRTLVFHVFCKPDPVKKFVKIDLQESFVDGVSMIYVLGFRVKNVEVPLGKGKRTKTLFLPYYPEDKLHELEAFVKESTKISK